MHQSDYCVQTSVLKLSDTKKRYKYGNYKAFFRSLFSCKAFNSFSAKLHLRARNKSKITQQCVIFTWSCHMTYENT